MDNINEKDFTIVVSPVLSEDGKKWTGGLYTSILYNNQSILDRADKKALYAICKLMCNAVLLSNIDDDFREHLEEFTLTNDAIHDLEDEFIDNSDTVSAYKKDLLNEEDNVIKINFKSKTKGNA